MTIRLYSGSAHSFFPLVSAGSTVIFLFYHITYTHTHWRTIQIQHVDLYDAFLLLFLIKILCQVASVHRDMPLIVPGASFYPQYGNKVRSPSWKCGTPNLLHYMYAYALTYHLNNNVQHQLIIAFLYLFFLSAYFRQVAPVHSDTTSAPGASVYPITRHEKSEHFRQCGTPNL